MNVNINQLLSCDPSFLCFKLYTCTVLSGQWSKQEQSQTEQLDMDGQAEKIKSLVNIIISYLAEFKFFPLQVLKQTEWVSGMAEDVLLSRMKNVAQKGRDTDPRDKRGTLDESVKSRLLNSFYDARRKEFQLKNLSEDEISFLFEYVSN